MRRRAEGKNPSHRKDPVLTRVSCLSSLLTNLTYRNLEDSGLFYEWDLLEDLGKNPFFFFFINYSFTIQVINYKLFIVPLL